MAKKIKQVTNEDKITFHRLYAKYGSYAAVARETGFSASTVARHIDPPKMSKREKQMRDELMNTIHGPAFRKW